MNPANRMAITQSSQNQSPLSSVANIGTKCMSTPWLVMRQATFRILLLPIGGGQSNQSLASHLQNPVLARLASENGEARAPCEPLSGRRRIPKALHNIRKIIHPYHVALSATDCCAPRHLRMPPDRQIRRNAFCHFPSRYVFAISLMGIPHMPQTNKKRDEVNRHKQVMPTPPNPFAQSAVLVSLHGTSKKSPANRNGSAGHRGGRLVSTSAAGNGRSGRRWRSGCRRQGRLQRLILRPEVSRHGADGRDLARRSAAGLKLGDGLRDRLIECRVVRL